MKTIACIFWVYFSTIRNFQGLFANARDNSKNTTQGLYVPQNSLLEMNLTGVKDIFMAHFIICDIQGTALLKEIFM